MFQCECRWYATKSDLLDTPCNQLPTPTCSGTSHPRLPFCFTHYLGTGHPARLHSPLVAPAASPASKSAALPPPVSHQLIHLKKSLSHETTKNGFTTGSRFSWHKILSYTQLVHWWRLTKRSRRLQEKKMVIYKWPAPNVEEVCLRDLGYLRGLGLQAPVVTVAY
jgi:hypothetical protein